MSLPKGDREFISWITSPRVIYGYLFFLSVTYLFGNTQISLWDQDEAAYAGMALKMIETDDWLNQEFMWSKIHRKPPLHLWQIALSYKIFGVHEFSVRFFSSIYIILTYLSIYLFGRRLFGQEIAGLAVIILSCSLLVPALAHVSVTDGTLLFYSTLCAFSVLSTLERPSWKWTGVCWISFSMALLTKGPPIIIFIGLFSLLLFIFHPKRKNLFCLHPWFFLPMAFVPLVVWGYLLKESGNEEMLNWMVDWYILKRVDGSVLGQTAPPGSHLLAMFVFFIPFLIYTPRTVFQAIKNFFSMKNPELIVLGAWLVGGWLLYEITPSKLPAYVVSAHIGLALLVSRMMVRMVEGREVFPARKWSLIADLLFILVIGGISIGPFFLNASILVKITFLSMGLVMVVTRTFLSPKFTGEGMIRKSLLQAILFSILLWGLLYPFAEGFKDTSKNIATYLSEYAKAESQILIGNTRGHPPSLPFYLRNFNQIKEEKDLDVLKAAYESNVPSVLILNNYLKRELEALVPGIDVEVISANYVDRAEKASYFIILNQSARK